MITLEKMNYLWGIEDCAFCGLTKLTRISLNDNPRLMVIDYDAFGDKKYFAVSSVMELLKLE